MVESAPGLRAGVGRVDLTPPVPIDLVGYSRRWQPATEVAEPLTATALVVEDAGRRFVMICMDLMSLAPTHADALRRTVAEAIGTSAEMVMLNVSHTHAAPQVSGRVKIGGSQREISEVERQYTAYLPYQLCSAARQAVARLEPVRVGAGSGSSDLAVNRRERTADGRTILGWNPDGPIDTQVGVLRVDRADGTPLAMVVNFGCHPVVIGPEDPAVGPDFAGPMRRFVEEVTGATCLFLQGAAGNILPLEGFFDERGPEERFGRSLGLEALHAAARIETSQTRIEHLDYGSVTPIKRYRRVPEDVQPVQNMFVATRTVELPLKRVPTRDELTAELAGYRRTLEEAVASGADGAVLNPLEYHVNWAMDAIVQLDELGPYAAVPAFLQAVRIGDFAVVGVPGETFAELSLATKSRAPLPTLFAGYTNGIISYLPSAAEYPYGGYEVDYAHHSFGLIEQVAPESEELLVDACVALVDELSAS